MPASLAVSPASSAGPAAPVLPPGPVAPVLTFELPPGRPSTSRHGRSRSSRTASFIGHRPAQRDRHDIEHTLCPGLVPVILVAAAVGCDGPSRPCRPVPGSHLGPHLLPFRPSELRKRAPQQRQDSVECLCPQAGQPLIEQVPQRLATQHQPPAPPHEHLRPRPRLRTRGHPPCLPLPLLPHLH